MFKHIEKIFGQWGSFVHDNPIKIILILLALLAFPLSHITEVSSDTSIEGFMKKDDPALLIYNDFKTQYGRDEKIVLAIKSDNIFTMDFMQKLKSIHEEIEQKVPFLEKVTSLYNIRNTRSEGDTLQTKGLMFTMPENQKDIDKLKMLIKESKLFKNYVVNIEKNICAIVIETNLYAALKENVSIDDQVELFDDMNQENVSDSPREFITNEQNQQIIEKLKEIIEQYQDKDFKVYVAGSPIVNNALNQNMSSDMGMFTQITFTIILIIMFVIFKRISAVVYTLFIILLALLSTIGLMAWTDTSFKLPTQIIPTLLLTVSVGASVHILSIFFDHFNKNGDKKAAIVFAMENSGLAIAMTSLTTIVGVGSFTGSLVSPIADLGIFASFGLIVSLVLNLSMLPALLSITKLKPKAQERNRFLNRLMARLAIFTMKYYKLIIIAFATLIILALWASSKIALTHYPLKWFPDNDPSYISTNVVDSNLNGSLTMEIVIEAESLDTWKNPQYLSRLAELHGMLEVYRDNFLYVGKVISLVDVVKETNMALSDNNKTAYDIPKDRNLLAQELLLFENSGSEDMEDFVDSDFTKTRITLKLPWIDSIQMVDVVRNVENMTNQIFPNEKVSVTGMTPLLVNTFSNTIKSSVQSYIIAFGIISVMMIFMMGSLRLGLLSLIPNMTPIILGLLIMYIVNIPLDMFTLLIGSVAIGLVVDDTIHFLHNYKRYYMQTGNTSDALSKTFVSTGKALTITSVVLALGFYSFMFGNMTAVSNFGFLLGSIIVLALISDLFLAPALLVAVEKLKFFKAVL